MSVSYSEFQESTKYDVRTRGSQVIGKSLDTLIKQQKLRHLQTRKMSGKEMKKLVESIHSKKLSSE